MGGGLKKSTAYFSFLEKYSIFERYAKSAARHKHFLQISWDVGLDGLAARTDRPRRLAATPTLPA
jgi:hypothetical protein